MRLRHISSARADISSAECGDDHLPLISSSFFNAGDILNFYDEKIYDKNKVSKIVGNDIFYTGLGIILIAIISIFLNNKYYYAMMITQTIILLMGLLLSCYHFFWTCKK